MLDFLITNSVCWDFIMSCLDLVQFMISFFFCSLISAMRYLSRLCFNCKNCIFSYSSFLESISSSSY
jgi:hypothetical protein